MDDSGGGDPVESAALLKRYEKILRIRINHSYAGFFAYLTFVINQLRYCEQGNLFPVVYFGPTSGDGPNAFHDPAHGDNTWDYYFEPVSGLTFDELRARVGDPHDPLSWSDVVELDSDFLWYLHAFDPDSVYNYPYGYYEKHPVEDVEAWYAQQRARARRYLARYVRPKPHILAKVDEFWRRHLEGFEVLGVHMRGSDKGITNTVAALNRIVEPEEYFPHIDRFLREAPGARIFLATEQSQFVDQVRERYGERVVTRDVIRTSAFGPVSNPFLVSAGDGYAKGEEVLIDCLLLSRSRRLLRCTSAVGEYAVYFNEALESIDLNRLEPGDATAASVPDGAVTTGPGAEVRVASGPDGSDAPVSGAGGFRELIGPGRLFEGAILINLDSRPDRLERSLAELARYGLDDAVVRMSAYAHENGMYGCSVSHVEAVRYARWKGWRTVLILEDDIRLCERFAEDAPAPLGELCGRIWGLFQLGVMISSPHLVCVSPNLFRFRHGHGAHAFALHARTYDFLLHDYVCELDRGNWEHAMHLPFDEYLNNRLTYFFEAYGSTKLLVSQHAGRSDTWGRDVDYRFLLEDVYEHLEQAGYLPRSSVHDAQRR